MTFPYTESEEAIQDTTRIKLQGELRVVYANVNAYKAKKRSVK